MNATPARPADPGGPVALPRTMRRGAPVPAVEALSPGVGAVPAARPWLKPNTDTGGELPLATDRTEAGQAGGCCEGSSPLPAGRDEFATRVSVGFRPNHVGRVEKIAIRASSCTSRRS